MTEKIKIVDPDGNWKIDGDTLRISAQGAFMAHRDFVFENAVSIAGFRSVLKEFRDRANEEMESPSGYNRQRARYVRAARDAWRAANLGEADQNNVRSFAFSGMDMSPSMECE